MFMFGLEEASAVFVVDERPEDFAALLAEPVCEGLRFSFFRTAGAALRAMRKQSPDLCIINMELPDLGGAELCEMLRERLYREPICLVRDDYTVDAELTARRCGATMFVCKPVDSQWLGASAAVVAK
ncbi:MAG: response regulator [Planctomycetota bacterium]|nr:MAG: response regulator [Planctomycetota bacterium]REJ97851.1 MAG: response regulator [Planctomycetota bacterium]REK18382.1 MAG: response regulator [Planctomycetota bacterium]REK40459.1 MAG: response regulator [Planctomycetota bacterium]